MNTYDIQLDGQSIYIISIDGTQLTLYDVFEERDIATYTIDKIFSEGIISESFLAKISDTDNRYLAVSNGVLEFNADSEIVGYVGSSDINVKYPCAFSEIGTVYNLMSGEHM